MQRRLARALMLPVAAVPFALAAPAAAATTPPGDAGATAARSGARSASAPRVQPARPVQARHAQLRPAQLRQAQLRQAQRQRAQAQRAQQLQRARYQRLHYQVKELQRRLRRAGTYSGPVNGVVTGAVARSLRQVQVNFGLPHVSATAPASLTQVSSVSRLGTSAPVRCRIVGKVLCISKGKRVVQAVHNGRVVMQADARFGRSSMPTREGTFRVGRKSANHVSGAYGSPMPYSMFFWRGQAVHYSSGFARVGYRGTSHGCVNLRSMPMAAALFNWAPTGTRVVIHRS